MARLLVLYGTTDGQTGKVARFLADELRRWGATVDLVMAGAEGVSVATYTGVIVAGSIHAGGYQPYLVRWVRDHAKELQQVPQAALLTVCLGILQPEHAVYQDLLRIQKRFVDQTRWRPTKHQFVAGALRYRHYGWLKRQVMRWMAGRAGGSTDTSRDHEYTDWEALGRFAAEFAQATHPPVVMARSHPRTVAMSGRL